MSDLVKRARIFVSSNQQRIDAQRNPAWQSHELHLKAVAQIVESVTRDEDVIAAAWLHDVVEDTGVTIGDLRRRFGDRVAKLVAEVTPVSRPGDGDLDARRQRDLQHFAGASAEAKTILLADVIDTARDRYKSDQAGFAACVADARALADLLEGGDSTLLARLRRGLETYATSAPAAEASKGAAKLRTTGVPISGLRVFERAFSAQDIAEPLLTFDADLPAREAAQLMREADAAVAGVRKNGVVCGFVEAIALGDGPCEAFRHEFQPSNFVSAGTSLTDVVEVLTLHDWCFVVSQGEFVGVISRADVQKPAVRMWLFGIITISELEFTERVRQKRPDGGWRKALSPSRLAKAEQLWSDRRRRNQRCELLDCLQLADKLGILIADPEELEALGFSTPSAAKRVGREFEKLRNTLAHAQAFVDEDWPQIVRLARRIGELVERL